MRRYRRRFLLLGLAACLPFLGDAAFVAAVESAEVDSPVVEAAPDPTPITEFVSSAHATLPAQGTPLDECWDAYAGNQCQLSFTVVCQLFFSPGPDEQSGEMEKILILGAPRLTFGGPGDEPPPGLWDAYFGLPPWAVAGLFDFDPSRYDGPLPDPCDAAVGAIIDFLLARPDLATCEVPESLFAECDVVGSNVYEQIDHALEYQSFVLDLAGATDPT